MAPPLGAETNSPSVDEGTNARVRNRPSVPQGRDAASHVKTATVPDGVSHYDVQKGDSFWSISLHRLGDPRFAADLATLNKLSPKAVLHAGRRLIVPNFERSDMTIRYMLAQMATNANGGDAKSIADATARHSLLGTGEAKLRWTLLVRAGGPWDHKPILQTMYKAMPVPPRPFGTLGHWLHFPIRGDVFHEFYYDIWSNIHFGYVGTRCGFDEPTLQGGAASGLPGAGTNDEGDVISVKIGIDLWRSHGLALSADSLRRAILAQTATYLAARAREIKSGIKEGEATNVVIMNNDYK